MRLAFLGTSAFAVPTLLALADSPHDIALVITQPPRPGNRGLPAARPVADAARELGLALHQPEKIRAPEEIARIEALTLDALVVAAYGQILPQQLLDTPRHGGINVHASILPRWRGASPVAAAILAGDDETGVSIMRMEAGLDTGPVYAIRTLPIGGGGVTTPDLTSDLARIGANLLVEVLAGIEDGSAAADPQDDAEATYAPRLTRADAQLDWTTMTATEIDRRVRALQPWPGTVAPLAGSDVRIVAGAPVPAGGRSSAPTAEPGTILAAGPRTIEVGTREGVYSVHEVQPPGRRSMDAAAYLRGRRITPPAAPAAAS
ncbi:MAG TPA: methionyl-tRNA formyltransferase [Candidatus Dormibacteraeota bacterium]|nr:methionyl-tRNA formyltransferase [Candidatus Dormibacteraeota bacterium]